MKDITYGTVFHKGYFTYIVVNWDDTDQLWICYSPNAQVTTYFSTESIQNYLRRDKNERTVIDFHRA